ncbi:MAG TPA: AgmX/PglI C-terminal domain-containing protein, partial [Polyangia bacterium]
DTSNSRELTQDDIDEGFRAREGDILECIARARPDAEAYIPGLVNVKFRIQKTGAVRGVRVEAPAILQKGGIYGCVKGVVEGIRFPSSGSSQIVTYPFRLS